MFLFLKIFEKNFMTENRKKKARGLHRVKASRDSIKLKETERMQRHQIQIWNRKQICLKQGLLSKSVWWGVWSSSGDSDHSACDYRSGILLPTVWTWHLIHVDTTVDVPSRKIGKIYNTWKVLMDLKSPTLFHPPYSRCQRGQREADVMPRVNLCFSSMLAPLLLSQSNQTLKTDWVQAKSPLKIMDLWSNFLISARVTSSCLTLKCQNKTKEHTMTYSAQDKALCLAGPKQTFIILSP